MHSLAKRFLAVIFLSLLALPTASALFMPQAVRALPRDPWYARFLTSGSTVKIFTTGNGLADTGNDLLLLPTTTKEGEITYYTFQGSNAHYAPDVNKPTAVCGIFLKIVVASNTPSQGRAYVDGKGTGDYGGVSACNDKVTNEAKAKFDNKNIALGSSDLFIKAVGITNGGAGPIGGGTNPGSNSVRVTVTPKNDLGPNDPIDPTKVPKTDKVELKGNETVKLNPATQTLDTEPAVISAPPNSSVHYAVTFNNVAPGKYRACSLTFQTCVDFEKKANEIANVAIAGSDSSKITINGNNASSTSNSSPPSCEKGDGALRWIMCPIITATDNALTWVDSRIQELLEVDEGYYNNPGVKAASANIRNIAYGILVPIMLVMVISTAIGFEIVSAYTLKRALPRLLAAVIFIALSYPICSFLIELSNIVGFGTLGIITAPFGNDVSNLTLSSLFGPGGVFTSIIIAPFAAIGVLFILWLFGGTLLLFAIMAFLVLMIRQMFIVALLLVAPLAILVWIFPGNDKMWKLWWGSFSKLLLMFPLIMALIGVGRVFAFTIHGANPAGLDGAILQPLMTLAAYMIPYALIPLTFKFAGGAFATIAGMTNDKGKGLFDSQRKKRAVKMERAGRQVTQKRADYQNRLQTAGSRGGNFRKYSGINAALRGASKSVGGYNIQALDAARRAAVGKEVNEQIATGRDEEIRGLSVNRKWADQHGRENVDYRTNAETGVKEYRTLGGAWVSEGAVRAGHKRWGNDTYAQQASLSYEMRKAASNEEVSRIAQRYQNTADAWGMSANQRAGTLKGAGFENQNTHLEFKHMNSDGFLNYDNFTKEMYEKKGSYPLAQMSAHTIDQLTAAYDDPNATAERRERLRAVAETFVQRGGMMPGMQPAGEDNAPIPIGPPPTPGSPEAAAMADRAAIYSSGAGHVNEAVTNFARVTGVIPNPATNAPGQPPNRNYPRSGSPQKG